MKIYKLSYDTDLFDQAENEGRDIADAYESNIEEISDREGQDFAHLDLTPGLEALPFEVVFRYRSEDPDIDVDHLHNVHAWPIIHSRVKELLEKEGFEGISFFPVTLIHDGTGSVNHDYFMMYSSNFIEAYDMEKSKYTYIAKFDAYMFFPMKTVFDENECSKYDVFRCVKDTPALYVSQRFFDVVSDAGFEGFSFLRVQ